MTTADGDSILSIVIPVFNKWNFTKSCLKDLLQLSPNNHEIIIIDNASSDETNIELNKLVEEEIDKMSLGESRIKITFFRNEENQGFAKACNKGYQLATGNNILFLNNDIRVKSDWTNWTKKITDSIKEDVLVGPTGGYVDPVHTFQFRYETADPKKPINYMSGWCLAASRDTWNKLCVPRKTSESKIPQVFSEEFGLAYFEDTDLGFRAQRLGINFQLVDIPVVHFGKISSSQLNINSLYSKARQIFINKWNFK